MDSIPFFPRHPPNRSSIATSVVDSHVFRFLVKKRQFQRRQGSSFVLKPRPQPNFPMRIVEWIAFAGFGIGFSVIVVVIVAVRYGRRSFRREGISLQGKALEVRQLRQTRDLGNVLDVVRVQPQLAKGVTLFQSTVATGVQQIVRQLERFDLSAQAQISVGTKASHELVGAHVQIPQPCQRTEALEEGFGGSELVVLERQVFEVDELRKAGRKSFRQFSQRAIF